MRFFLPLFLLSLSASASRYSVPIKISSLNHRLYFGSAVNMKHVNADPGYARYASKEFSILTPENEFKFISIHPEQNGFDFKSADSLVDFAKRNHQLVRGHTLVWHNPEALPRWLTGKKHSPKKLRAILRNHIEKTVKHFKKTAKNTVPCLFLMC